MRSLLVFTTVVVCFPLVVILFFIVNVSRLSPHQYIQASSTPIRCCLFNFNDIIYCDAHAHSPTAHTVTHTQRPARAHRTILASRKMNVICWLACNRSAPLTAWLQSRSAYVRSFVWLYSWIRFGWTGMQRTYCKWRACVAARILIAHVRTR